MKRTSMLLNIIYNFIRTVMGIVFPVITFAYASRILGAEGLGRVNFAKTFSYYFVLLATLGISNYGIREAAGVRDDKKKLSQLVTEIFVINFISMIISLVIYISVCFFVPSLHYYRTLLLICIFSIMISPLSMEWLYGAMEDFGYITVRTVVFQIISLILLFLLVKDKSDVSEYMFVTIFSGSASYILNFFNIRKYVNLKYIGKLNIKKHIAPIMLLFAMSISINLYNGLDTTMLGFTKGDYEVGIYTAASKVNRMVVTIITSLSAVLVPRLSYYVANKNKEEFNYLIRQAFNILLMFSVPAFIGLMVLNNNILQIFSGPGYDAAYLPMLIMNPIILIIPLNTLINIQIFIPMKKEKLILIATCTSALINIIFNSICIPRFGICGAAIGTVLAESFGLIVSFNLSRKYYNLATMFGKVWQYILASLPFFIISILFNKLIKDIYIQTFVILALCVCIYCLILLLFKNEYFFIILKKLRFLFKRKKK